MRLYSMSLSGSAYKARLGLALMGLEYELVETDWRKGETRTDEFLRVNPRGQVPVLEEGELIVWDSQAIPVTQTASDARANSATSASPRSSCVNP